MKRIIKNIFIIISIVCICFGAFAVYIWENPPLNLIGEGDSEHIKQLEKEVSNYLINVKGYKKSKILELKGFYSKEFKDAGYRVNVTFRDEPNAAYEFEKRDGQIVIINVSGISSGKAKHAEELQKCE